jgi:hypothetical protein
VDLVTRDDVLTALAPYRGLSDRVFSATSTYGFQQDGSDWTYQFGKKGDRLVLADSAWDYAFKVAGIRQAGLERFRRELVVPLIDEAFHQTESELKAVVKDDAIVAFTQAKAEAMDPNKLLRLMEKGVGGRDKIKGYQVYVDWTRTYLTLVGSDEMKMGVARNDAGKKVKDLYLYGASASASLLGLDLPSKNYPLDISGWSHRLICTNGLISAQNVMNFTRKDAKDQDRDEWIVDRTGQVYAAGATDFDRLKALRDIPLSNHTAETLDSIFGEFGIPTKVRSLIASRHMNEPAQNMLELLNHMTYVASNYAAVVDDPLLQRRMQQAAGSVIQHHSLCNSCFQLLPQRRGRSIAELEDETGDTRRN